jgi:hypothetical protein
VGRREGAQQQGRAQAEQGSALFHDSVLQAQGTDGLPAVAALPSCMPGTR